MGPYSTCVWRCPGLPRLPAVRGQGRPTGASCQQLSCLCAFTPRFAAVPLQVPPWLLALGCIQRSTPKHWENMALLPKGSILPWRYVEGKERKSLSIKTNKDTFWGRMHNTLLTFKEKCEALETFCLPTLGCCFSPDPQLPPMPPRPRPVFLLNTRAAWLSKSTRPSRQSVDTAVSGGGPSRGF